MIENAPMLFMTIFIRVHCGCLAHQYDFHTEELIWSEEFESHINETKWNFVVSDHPKEDSAYYRQNASNQYISNGVLNLDHTFTALDYGEQFLYYGELDLYELDKQHPCRDYEPMNKEKNCFQKSGPDILPPVSASRMDTEGKFSFKYGRVEIRTKNALADFVRTALWMMPETSEYGDWPRSGEIDINESSGNRHLKCGQDEKGSEWFQARY